MPDIFNFSSGSTLVVFLGIVILVLLVAYLGSRYKVAAANEALVVSGRREKSASGEQRLKVVRGQGTIVLPLLHRVGRLKLTARQINVSLTDAVTQQGIKVAVQGVATFKIGADDESIQNAAERFLESKDADVDSIVKNVLEGSLRSIVGTLTVEELNLDRMKFQQAVQSAAKGDLATSGLQIDSFTIQSIIDESGYMELIGEKNQAIVARDARMAKATADQEASVREAEAEQIKINAQRDVSVRRAETEMQIAAAQARAGQAGPLAQAEATQEVVRKQTELADLEAGRKQKELLTSIVRPAEADAEALIRRAEGEKQARIAQAQADAERVKLGGGAEAAIAVMKGEANARVTLVNAEAEAQRTTLEGVAEAGIVFTKGEAEAKALALRAEAYRQFNDAALIQTVLSMLPEIVRAAAEPMASIGSLTVLSSEGASDLVRTTTRTVVEAGAVVKGLTGIDIPAILGGAVKGDSRDGGASAGGDAGPAPPRSGPTRPPARPAPRSVTGAGPSSVDVPSTSAGSSSSARTEAGPGGMAPPADRASTAFADAAATISGAEASVARSMERAAAVMATASAAAETAAETAPDAAPEAPPARARRAPGVPAGPTPAAGTRLAGLSRESTVEEAAALLARQLKAVPGIESHAGMRLADLDRIGPRPVRLLWRVARGDLDRRYGRLTIGELMERYGTRGGGPGASPRA